MLRAILGGGHGRSPGLDEQPVGPVGDEVRAVATIRVATLDAVRRLRAEVDVLVAYHWGGSLSEELAE